MALPKNLTPYIAVGRQARLNFEDIVDDYYSDFDSHAFIYGPPGIGKTKKVIDAAIKAKVILCMFEGNVTCWAFTKKLAVYLYQAGWPPATAVEGVDFKAADLPKVVVYGDDVSKMFESDFVDVLKIALEEEISDKLVYTTSLGSQYAQSEQMEKDAIDHFRIPGDTGFTANFYSRVKFIFTMNHKLADQQDVNNAKKGKTGVRQINRLMDQAALRSRMKYQDHALPKNVYWGLIADLILTQNILKGATIADKEEILEWLYSNWDNLSEHSIRTVKQKMWKDMQKAKTRKAHDYKSRWFNLVRVTE